MKLLDFPTFFVSLVLAVLPSGTGLAWELTFEERVAAQEAIDRIYYSHQVGATAPFEVAVPRGVIERRVRTYLEKSEALDQFWHTPITAEMLSRELARMAGQTMMPERLAQLFGALGHDRFLVEECLARPALADRLARNFFAYDDTMHRAARAQAERLREDLASGRIDPTEAHPLRAVVELDAHAEAPRAAGVVGELEEERAAFVVRVALDETQDGNPTRIAVYAIPKRTFEDWFSEERRELDSQSVRAVAALGADLPALGTLGTSGLPCVPDGTWANGSLEVEPQALGGRRQHTAVWTGSEMLIWGGYGSNGPLNDGLRYDPATDSWGVLEITGAPSPRTDHTAVWTGTQMIIWGGFAGPFFDDVLNTGGRYDPVTDTWSSTTLVLAPTPRTGHTAVWTGSEMIVWGGAACQASCLSLTGGRYNPVTNSWTATTTVGAPVARELHTAVWTGSKMVVWGGRAGLDLPSGGLYDPSDNTWKPTASIGVAAARRDHTAVWTGSKMVVWGGLSDTTHLATGARYDPQANSWQATSITGAPEARTDHTAVWTGNRMIVWGGTIGSGSSGFDTGASYDPVADTWSATPVVGAPSRRYSHTAVWTGELMVVWGGEHAFDEGGRYDALSDSWTPTAVLFPAPASRHTAVWTGVEMIVWGGHSALTSPHRMGGRYDPATDSWTETERLSAPTARMNHTAVWTGDEMIVWGGDDDGVPWSSGGRYDPWTDDWTPTSTVGAPLARTRHTAIWTGTEMIVWGGLATVAERTGGRYEPLSDSWTPTADATFQASATYDHTAVWTGAEMIVWGGVNGNVPAGSRYDVATNSWTPTSQVNAPVPRHGHSAVWVGDRMIVWGGTSTSGSSLNNGRSYDPVANTWTATSQTGAPSARSSHTAVWTGDRMIVWGGALGQSSGGEYEPTSGTWTPTSTVSAPIGRREHTAVWTGSHMIIWGGNTGNPVLGTGGRYVIGSAVDDDGDAFSECDGDCNDGHDGVYPGAVEVCDNGLDNDCSGVVDDGDVDQDGFQCAGDCDDDDPGVFAVPSAVADLLFGPDPSTLSWESVVPGAGSATVHDVVRGSLAELPAGGGAAETCVAPGIAENTASDSDEPVGGFGYWYLVRGRNTCGAGSYDEGGGPEPTACP